MEELDLGLEPIEPSEEVPHSLAIMRKLCKALRQIRTQAGFSCDVQSVQIGDVRDASGDRPAIRLQLIDETENADDAQEVGEVPIIASIGIALYAKASHIEREDTLARMAMDVRRILYLLMPINETNYDQRMPMAGQISTRYFDQDPEAPFGAVVTANYRYSVQLDAPHLMTR